MSKFADCQDVRNMKTIREVTCPHCHQREALELIEKDGLTVNDCICDECGYTVPEGVNFECFLRETPAQS